MSTAEPLGGAPGGAAASGRRARRTRGCCYHDMAEDMVALLDTLHVRRVDVMGWSDGGDIGLDLAIHHPERIVHLVTFGANASPDGSAMIERPDLVNPRVLAFLASGPKP